MNEKIQQLVKQANREIGEKLGQPGVYLDFGPAKYFAELIVRECEQVSLMSSHRDDDMGAIIAKHIKEHFGVEL